MWPTTEAAVGRRLPIKGGAPVPSERMRALEWLVSAFRLARPKATPAIWQSQIRGVRLGAVGL